jgi:hypothetical protein
MGCLSRLIVVVALLVQVVAAGLGMLVLGSAGVLGEAALISSTDALVMFVLLALSLLATCILTVKLWLASRTRKRLERDFAVIQTSNASSSTLQ